MERMQQRSYAWFNQLAWVKDLWKALNCACNRNTHVKYTKALNMQGSFQKCKNYHIAVSAVQAAASCDKCLHLCCRRAHASYTAYSARAAFYRTQPGERQMASIALHRVEQPQPCLTKHLSSSRPSKAHTQLKGTALSLR